jgi:hypothetical protein
MDLPTYAPVLYFGIGLISGAFGIFGWAVWVQKQEALSDAPKTSRKWDKVESFKLRYTFEVCVRPGAAMADIAEHLFLVLSRRVKGDKHFQSSGEPCAATYTVVIDGAVHFTLRPETEPLQGVSAPPSS